MDAIHAPPKSRANHRLKKQAKKVTQQVQTLGDIAQRIARENLAHRQESAAELKDQGREKAQQVQRTVEQLIQERPFKCMLIAAGVGLLFGRFWMRR